MSIYKYKYKCKYNLKFVVIVMMIFTLFNQVHVDLFIFLPNYSKIKITQINNYNISHHNFNSNHY